MYVLLLVYKGIGDKPSADVERIKRVDGVTVVNTQLPKSIVVQVRGDREMHKLMDLPNWSLSTSHTARIDPHVEGPGGAKNGMVVSKYLRSVPK